MATDVGVPEPSFASSMLRDPSTVCCSRSVRPDEPRTEPQSVIRSSTHRPHTANCPSLPKTNVVNFQPGVAQTDDQAGLPRQPSALGYSNYIAKRYPKMDQNARAIWHVTMARYNIQNDMVTFTDKLMSTLATSCTCCTARGLTALLDLTRPLSPDRLLPGTANEKASAWGPWPVQKLHTGHLRLPN